MHLKVCQREGCFNVFDDNHGRKFCSDKCRKLDYYQRVTKDRKPPPLGYRFNCTNCGRLFWTKNRYRKYCSDACKQMHYRERKFYGAS